MKPVHILLIDDHAMFRAGLAMVLAMGIPGIKISEAGSLADAMAVAPDDVDVVLLDVKLKGFSGLEGMALLRGKWPLVPILMLSSHDEPETVREAMARGAAGFVSKSETAEKIVETISQVLLDPFPGQTSEAFCPEKQLTLRQHEVMELLYQGLSNKLIARKLTLSENTVRRHVQDILEHFHVASRAEAVCAARRKGLVG